MEKVFRGACSLFTVCFVLASASVLLQAGWLLTLLPVAGILALRCGLLPRLRPLPHFTWGLFWGVLTLRVVILLLLHPPIVSDFRMLFDAAHGVLSGDLSFRETVYFSLWGYQSVFVAWEAFWLLLWDSPFCPELVNAVLAAGTACLLYRLSREWAGRRAAQAASLLMVFLPFSATLHTVLSNQIPSAFFLTLGLWVLVCGDCEQLGFLRFPLAGLAMQAGELLRSEGMIFLVAVLTWAVFRVLQKPELLRRMLAGLAALFAVYFTVHAGADALVRASGLCPYGLENRDPAWKVVTGLNPETRGGYSGEDWALIWPTLDGQCQLTEETQAVQSAMIEERLAVGPCGLLCLLWDKINHQWVSDGLHWAVGHLRTVWPRSYAFAQQFDRWLFFLALLLAVCGLPGNRKQFGEVSAYLPYFIFFAAFCAFLMIEVQPRYAYLPQLYVFTAAAFGLHRLEGSETCGEAVDRRPLLQ